jgi:hypothetical protein
MCFNFVFTQNPWILDFSDIVLNSTVFSIFSAKKYISSTNCTFSVKRPDATKNIKNNISGANNPY